MNQEILDLVAQFDIAFKNNNLDTVMDFFADDATWCNAPGQTVIGKANIRKAFTAIIGIDSDLEMKKEKVTVLTSSDTALYTCQWCDNNETFYAACVFRKNSTGKWLIILDNPFLNLTI